MGNRLQYRIDLPDELREVRIPPLLLQPLVENAIKHGLERSVQGGEVAVSCLAVKGMVRIIVADSGKGMDEQDSSGIGMGLDNVRKRLSLLYGTAATLFLEENTPTGVKVTVEIPVESR
jgi:LytS/YehU family sensor histidine kinase